MVLAISDTLFETANASFVFVLCCWKLFSAFIIKWLTTAGSGSEKLIRGDR
jgi:hypothetical protein